MAEHPETFGLRITAADGAVLAEPEATGSIIDDDGRPAPPVLSLGPAEVVEGSVDGAVLRFPVKRAPADAPDVSSVSWRSSAEPPPPARTSRGERVADRACRSAT